MNLYTGNVNNFFAVFMWWYATNYICDSGKNLLDDKECFRNPKQISYIFPMWITAYMVGDLIIWWGIFRPKGTIAK